MKTKALLKHFLYLIQGAIVGVGAILPGVSGGVLCVAFGVYEPMMELMTTPVKAIKKNGKMFLPFVVGWMLGFLLLAKGIELLFEVAGAVALMLFFGLICGTLPELIKQSEEKDGAASWTPFVISLAAAYLLFHLLEIGPSITLEPTLWAFLLCGLLWGLSLIIPGMSSSSILICLGLFEPMTSGIAALEPKVLLPMLLGISLTALALARVVNTLYKKRYALMSRIVLGFVIASSLKALPTAFNNGIILIISLICFALGFAVARIMDIAQRKQSEALDEKG